MKIPEYIKQDIIDCMDEAIVVNETGDAHDLLDFADKAHVCMATALAYIRQLEANYQQVSKALCVKENATLEEVLHAVRQVKVELETVKRERDAAVADIKTSQCCSFCIHRPKDDECTVFRCMECDKVSCVCRECFHGEKLEWRGVCTENTEVQEDE